MLISSDQIRKAEKILVDNGLDNEDAMEVLTAIGYVLLGKDLYTEEGAPKNTVV